ncbi:MAG: hypothetical protein II563_04710 [Treponema sp.]|nr:hypothetical protein [Treponema sp.]MBQ2552131.1 hypothetical protein [Treponema sp.]MBQ4235771.1 hypothetical protein [Treponema sp.]MBQ5384390.1 hypothetical protein [Treponema sp.]
MIDFEEITDKARTFVDEHKILSVGIILGVVVLLIILVLVIGISAGSGKKKNVTVEKTFAAEDDFVKPQAYTMTEDYYFSRKTEDSWSQEEVDKWFAVPTSPVMNELRKDNDSIVDEILGAAP